MSGSLDRNRIMKLFETLSARLAARGIRGQLYIVGGSAMIVAYGRERTTRDVDARIEYAKDDVLAAAEEIAAEENLDANWLNENARLFMPPARDDRARTVFNTPGLVVTGASAEHMLAMKIDATRRLVRHRSGPGVFTPLRRSRRRARSSIRACVSRPVRPASRELPSRGDGHPIELERVQASTRSTSAPRMPRAGCPDMDTDAPGMSAALRRLGFKGTTERRRRGRGTGARLGRPLRASPSDEREVSHVASRAEPQPGISRTCVR